MTYKELLDHLDTYCPLYTKCPAKCGCSQEFVNISELRKHIVNDCIFTNHTCQICQTTVQRQSMQKNEHTFEDCARVLLVKNQKLEAQNHDLLQEIRLYEDEEEAIIMDSGDEDEDEDDGYGSEDQMSNDSAIWNGLVNDRRPRQPQGER